jgi:predicted permease
LFVRILLIMAPLSAVVLLGFFYARRVKPDLSGANKLAVDLCLPALVFYSLSTKQFVINQQAPFLLAATLIIVISGLLAWPVARVSKADPRSFLPTVMFGNVGPVGVPVTVLAFGQEGLASALLLLVISNVLHFTLGVRIMSGKADFRSLLLSPLIWSTILGITFSAMRWTMPEWLMTAIKMVGDILIPLMLLSMGARLVNIPWQAWRIGSLGGTAAPVARMIAAGLCIAFLPLDTVQRGALFLFAALPPAVFNFLLADRFNRSPEEVASMVLIGHLLSLLFLPLGLVFALRA